jgi:hypothetical protein
MLTQKMKKNGEQRGDVKTVTAKIEEASRRISHPLLKRVMGGPLFL